ncbi:MAG TPA: hypothetical protein VFB82_03595, partial [Blastocatellia bacterium]|nr:hypothetical protein [Blastocatellia bacterium]
MNPRSSSSPRPSRVGSQSNPGSLPLSRLIGRSLTLAVTLMVACATFGGLTSISRAAGTGPATQKKSKAKTGAAAPVARLNDEYTAKIKEYTTEKYFLTELVDHLPASDKVPSPDKVLGYAIGTPNKLTYTKDMYRYYRELEKATP